MQTHSLSFLNVLRHKRVVANANTGRRGADTGCRGASPYRVCGLFRCWSWIADRRGRRSLRVCALFLCWSGIARPRGDEILQGGSDACRIAASLFRRFAPYEASIIPTGGLMIFESILFLSLVHIVIK